MVLKVRGLPERGWVFYDGMVWVRHTGAEWFEEKSQVEREPTIFIFKSYDEILSPDSICVDFGGSEFKEDDKSRTASAIRHGYCCIAICRKDDGREQVIAFTEGYLLSNEGKTIERL